MWSVPQRRRCDDDDGDRLAAGRLAGLFGRRVGPSWRSLALRVSATTNNAPRVTVTAWGWLSSVWSA
jgi:hypothetical protein